MFSKNRSSLKYRLFGVWPYFQRISVMGDVLFIYIPGKNAINLKNNIFFTCLLSFYDASAPLNDWVLFNFILFRYLWGLKVRWQKEAEWLTSSKLITNPWRFLDWLVKCQTLMREVLREQFSWVSFHMCLIGEDEQGVGFRLVIFQEASNQISDLGLSFSNSINPLK